MLHTANRNTNDRCAGRIQESVQSRREEYQQWLHGERVYRGENGQEKTKEGRTIESETGDRKGQ